VRRLAKEVLGEELGSKVWSRLEIVGDIALLRKPPDVPLDSLRKLAERLINELPYVKSVWAAITPVEGSYRLRRYEHLAGECRSSTIYREHGCKFYIDITKVYVSPALNYEHLRVARCVKEGEFIINMFAGAGLFSIIIAKYARPSKVISIDINPNAYELMIRNVELNNVGGIVEPVLGDAGEVIEKYLSTADRVLMPLPELAYEYFEKAIKALKDEGVIHVYDFVSTECKGDATAGVAEKYISKSRELGVSASVIFSRVVRSVGPRKYQVVLDIYVRK